MPCLSTYTPPLHTCVCVREREIEESEGKEREMSFSVERIVYNRYMLPLFSTGKPNLVVWLTCVLTSEETSVRIPLLARLFFSCVLERDAPIRGV
jgi:hypothetical protein